jgi:Domain of Unknown Function with PDB structure (DUF3857)/Domain of Unknown Function with PDB structure (DUF3858)/Transglutaminase-like superfamily
MKRCFLFLMALLCATYVVTAQDKSPVKFGKITAADFTIKQPFDTGASAVVIADIGTSIFEGNVKGWFSLVYKRFRRIKILNKNGFEAAKVEIPLYADGTAEEKLDDLKAYTYNLENGKVVETKLDGASVFKDKLSKKHTVRKFTFPAVKEGSVIEYSYTIKSDFLFNLQPWSFQDEYPCLWSEYQVDIPEFFQYVTLNQGFMQLEKKLGSYPSTFRVTVPGGADKDEQVTLNGNVNTTRWVVKNIPALKEENFTSAMKNYVSSVEFQLSAVQFQGQMPHDYMGNWKLMSEKLMEGEHFGASLSKNNNWLDDDLKNVTSGITSKLEKAKKIFAYVRDNETCTDYSAIYIESSLKDAYKKHSGSVADINMLLIAMLRHEGIEADPLILSTKDNGFTNEIYPLVDRFNYVICEASIDGVYYNLDASSPYNGFAKLPPYCYNGHARVITKESALPVYFEADSLREQKMTTVFITNDEKGGLSGSFKSQLGYYESFSLRKKLKGDSKDYLKNIKSGNSFEMTVSEAAIDSLKKPDMPALIHYEFAFKPSADDNIIYLSPMMSEGYKENPFKSAERKYPVEMSYTFDEIYLLNMEIPAGYTVDEVPKSAKVAFNDDEGFFEYLIQKSDDGIQLRTRIKLNKATFTPEDYNGLRDFFAFIVKKQNEQIVLKKK